MSIRDLSAVFDTGIDYPNVPSRVHPEGATYRVPSPDAQAGLWLKHLYYVAVKSQVGEIAATDLAALQLDDDEERNFYQRVLGCGVDCGQEGVEPCASVYHVMLADGVPWQVFTKLAQDAYLAFIEGEQTADRVLEGLGKANRATRRAAEKAGRKSGPASGGTATRTPRRASSASSSPTASKPRKAAARKAG